MLNPELFKIIPKLTQNEKSEKAPTVAPKGDFQKLVDGQPAEKTVDEEDDIAEDVPEKTSLFSLSATKPTATKPISQDTTLPETDLVDAGELSSDFKIPQAIQENSLKAIKSIVPALSPSTDAVPMLPGGKVNLDQSAINVPTLPDEPVAKTEVKIDPKVVTADPSQTPLLSPKLDKPLSKIVRPNTLDRDSMDTDSTVPLSKLDDKPKINVRASLTEDRPDLAYLAPKVPDAPIVGTEKPVEAKPMPATMKQIAAEVVKSIDIMKFEGKTETIVTLNNGVFKDAVLTITAFDNIKGQFNINFGNLNDIALNIISRPDNQNALESALISKGFTPVITISQEGTRQFTRSDKEGQPGQQGSNPEEGQG